ncbi:MAG: ATP-binding protein [Saprospiraceae bacterium]
MLIYDHLPVIDAISLQMTQLFSNIIGNALKFSRNDRRPVITISAIGLTEEEKQGATLDPALEYIKIKFEDNGIGFKEEYEDKIFNIFQRLHRKSEYAGTGIGLAMCKKIALNHHGDLHARGSSENGAVFNVILPIKQLAYPIS